MPSPYHALQARVAFIIEIDKLKAVLRKNKPITLERYENSAEHSWQVAMLALAMAPHATESINIERVIRLLLVHDIGEIDTGDTIFYAEEGLAERKAAELAAVKRIFGLLPAPQAEQLLDDWLEFDAGQSAEARFAHAMDRMMPILLNLNSQGQSWRENGISRQQVQDKAVSQVAAGCPQAADWLSDALSEAEQQGWLAPR
ncbi:HD domain-containing protein [Craterilacuibacter sp. RT1T]|uniref:HD domain-containing protein n=1 Tax=Craterilacuibacter sp. RT1T TaxID=2942211 RepID=UPI0020C0ACDB|nr:HD domain-containing protein [Craterilacuibacter sp. RT1T]MCL6262914.1 HD domain-containing protein [Craterilacuibacter sp. RT1T]